MSFETERYSKYTALYRREVGTLDGRDQFYSRVEAEVKELNQLQPQIHHPDVVDLPASEAEKHWKKQADQTRFLILQNSLPGFRPPSPDFRPTSAEEKFYRPAKPLGTVSDNESSFTVTPYGVKGQFALYKTQWNRTQRNPQHLRVGHPAYEYRLNSVYSKAGLPALQKLQGFRYRFDIFKNLPQSQFTAEQIKQVSLGLQVALESLDLSSELFRDDVFACLGKNHRDQDAGVGFSAFLGKRETPTEKKVNGITVYGTRPTRISEIAFKLSELRQLFPKLRDRCIVRGLLGCSSNDLPDHASLLSLEEYSYALRGFSILPKRRRLSFVIEVYESGVCIGTCFFSATLKTFRLALGENCIEPRLYVSEAFNHRLSDGPLSQYEYLKKDWRSVRGQQEAIECLEDEYKSAMEQLAALHYCLDSHEKVQKLIPLPDRQLRLLSLQYYNEALEDTLVLKILKYKGLQQMLRTRSELNQGIPVQQQRILEDAPLPPLEPGYTNVRMGSQVLRLTTTDLQHIDLYFQQEVQPLINAEIAIRRKVKTLGYTWTRPAAMQELVLRVKGHAQFLHCNDCSTRVYRPGCECVSQWLEQKLLGNIQDPVFQGCEVCLSFDETVNPCHCHIAAAEEIQAELARYQDGDQGPACLLCLNFRSCKCPLLALIEHAEGDEEAYDEISEYFTPRSSSVVTESLTSRSSTVTSAPSTSSPPSASSQGSVFKTAQSKPAATSAAKPEHRFVHPFYGRTGRPTPQVAPVLQSPAKKKVISRPDSNIASEGGSLAGIPSIADESEMSLMTVSESLHSLGSIHEIKEDSTSELAAVANGDVSSQSPDQEVSGADLVEALASEPSLTGIQPGHLTVAYKRSQNYDPMTAAVAELDFQAPKPPKVRGYSKIPAGYVPFNGDIEGDVHGVPKTYQRKKSDGVYEDNNSTPALYRSSIFAFSSDASTESMKERYTRGRPDGTRFCPRGTLNKILSDLVTAEHVEEPSDVPDFLLAGPTGYRVYHLCQPTMISNKVDEAPKMVSRKAIKIRSLRMEEPTDVPPHTRRTWLHKVVDAESHGNLPLEISLQFSGQLSLQSHGWEEIVLPDGRRGMKSMVPGKSAGTFTLSCGGSRGEGFDWPLKLGARWLVILLCGGGKRMSKRSFLSSGNVATDIPALRAAQAATTPLVLDQSEGARPDSKTIDPEYAPESFYGKWEKISEPGKEDYFQRCDWGGFGFKWRMHGFDEDYGHRVTLTIGDSVPVDTLNAIYGLHYWAVSHFDAMKARYEEIHRASGRVLSEKQLSRCFGPLRFSLAALDPKWSRFVPLVSRILGSDWKDHLERLMYALNDNDYDVVFNYASTVGPDVDLLLGEEKQFPDVDVEQIGRVDNEGRAVYLEEEINSLENLSDFGHFYAAEALTQRACMSLKAYGTHEFAETENL